MGLLAFLLLVVSGVAATAASACNNTRSNNQPHHYWDGMSETDHTYGTPYSCIFGAEGTVYTTSPSVLSPDGGGENSFSGAYVGVQFYNATDYTLGQVGWLKFYSGTVNTFAEIVHDHTGWKTGLLSGPANGSYHDFKVTYSYANNTFHFFKDLGILYDWQYTPALLGCDYNTEGVMDGEITSAHNQMPGTQGNPQTIQAAQVMSNGGSWKSGTGWLGDDSNTNWFYNAISYSSGYANSTFYDLCN